MYFRKIHFPLLTVVTHLLWEIAKWVQNQKKISKLFANLDVKSLRDISPPFTFRTNSNVVEIILCERAWLWLSMQLSG